MANVEFSSISKHFGASVAVAGGWAGVGDRSLVQADKATIKAARASMRKLQDVNVERMKTEAANLPLLVAGGGAILVDWPVQSVSEVLRPEYSSVANAVGAAITQVSGKAERVVTLNEATRGTVLDDARQEAKDDQRKGHRRQWRNH